MELQSERFAGTSAFQRRVVVVTGASAGVGRATARSFARNGCAVALLARGEDGLTGALADVDRLGGRGLAIPVDVSDPIQVEAAAERIERELGPIDVWVNNAMVTVMSRIADALPEDYRRVTEVTYLGAVHGTLSALRRMLPRDRGTIVQVGSALSYRAIPLQSAYCAAKHALRGFTDSLRTELMHERRHVRVTMVQLPALDTPQFEWSRIRFDRQPQPVPPIYAPEVAAEAITFAADAGRREVWVGGWNAVLMLGNQVAPWLGDWYLARTGYDAQFTDQPADPHRPDNLFEPRPGDHGASGLFRDRSRRGSLQLWATRHRATLGGAVLCVAVLIALAIL
jgi:NAD(P)-dependent dehydrogenase (short-subunit alcohol dehydrogenase family)